MTLPAILGKRALQNARLPRRNTDKVEVIKNRFKLLVGQSQPNEAKLKETGMLIEINSNNMSFLVLYKDLLLGGIFSWTTKE